MALFNRQKKNDTSSPASASADTQGNAIAQQRDFFAEAKEKLQGGSEVSHNVWQTRPKEWTMLLLVGVMVLIFIFFFLSPVLFTGGAKDVGDPTPVGSAVSLDDGSTLTITSWKYAPAQNCMEIKMSMNNEDYAESGGYDFQAKTKRGSDAQLSVTPLVSDSDYIVLLVQGIPARFTALKVNVYSLADEQNSKTGTVSSIGGIMCLQKEVSQVSKITPKSANEYRADVYLDQIPGYQANIDSDNQQIQANKNAITRIENNLAEMTRQAEQPMPKDRLTELYQQMQEAQAQKESYESSIKELQQDIAANQRVIAQLRAQASYYTSN